MENMKNSWKGLRAIAVVRQSLDAQGTASTAAQLDYMKKTFAHVGMEYVDAVVLEGVRASAPKTISEVVQELFERKRTRNDFDVIGWQIEDRASRGGGEHGMWLQHEAKRNGLRVFYPGDDAPKVQFGAVIRVLKYEAAFEGSVSTGRRSTQGQSHAIKTGFFRTSGQTPIGCDRLYLCSENVPKFILHNLPDGRQEQRDFKTGQIIGKFGSAERKSKNRFRKQRNEYSLLYPGNRTDRRTVRVIFYLRYKWGWRGMKIADFLNRNGIPSPRGKVWSPRQVQIIYENPAYTGVTYNGQTFSGRFFRRDREMGFVALDRDEVELVQKKTFAPKLRQIDDWERIDQPYMYDFLPRDVRDLAITAHNTMWQDRTDPARPKKKPTAHPSSDFLFSGRLRAIQDGGLLTGTMSGTAEKPTPYYRHPRSRRGRLKDSVFNRVVCARSLHEATISVLADILLDTPELRAKLTQFVEGHRLTTLKDEPDVAALEGERDELRKQIKSILSIFDGAALSDAQDELQRLARRRNDVETRLAARKGKQTQDSHPVNVVVDDAIRILQHDRQQLLTMSVEVVRDLVNRLVSEATVDMETKAVELKIAFPTWATTASKKIQQTSKTAFSAEKPVCSAQSLRSQMGDWTHQTLASYRCEYEWNRGSTTVPPCYRCSRSAA